MVKIGPALCRLKGRVLTGLYEVSWSFRGFRIAEGQLWLCFVQGSRSSHTRRFPKPLGPKPMLLEVRGFRGIQLRPRKAFTYKPLRPTPCGEIILTSCDVAHLRGLLSMPCHLNPTPSYLFCRFPDGSKPSFRIICAHILPNPTGPCTQTVYTLAPKYLHRGYFKVKVYTIWVHGPFGKS